MATHFSHSALPFPVRNARYTVVLPFMDADGDPTDPTATLDTEISVDNGAFADAAEELSVIGSGGGWGIVTLSGAEMNNSLIVGQVKNGAAKAPQFVVQPRTLPLILSGTAQAGAAGTITLPSAASALDDVYNGCIVRTTGGTGGGGTGGANNQARVIKDYVGSTRVATIEPNWETNPDATTTLEVLATDLTAVTGAALASSLLDEATAGHTTTGTVGKALIDVLAAVDTEIAAIKAKTDNLPSDPADASDIAASFSSIASTLSTIAGYIDTEVASVLSAVLNLVAAGYTRTGTAQAGASGTITLDAGASSVDDFYNNQIIVIASGQGAGQARFISDYVGSTKVASVATWATNPNNTSVFYVLPFGAIPGATAPTATEVRQEMDNNSTRLANLDATVSSRSSHTAAQVWSSGTRTLSDGAGVKKNTALNNFPFKLVDASGNPALGATVTATRMIDGGSFGACANSASEVANGWYRINLAAADMNGDIVTLRFTATGAQTREITLFTEP